MDTTLMWKTPRQRASADLALSQDTIHVWCAPLLARPAVRALLPLLSADERQRSERFRFERDRQRFVATRGRLRMLLGAYLGQEPAAIELDYGAHGKPLLGGALRHHPLRFNTSHSREMALFAVAVGREVGVDVEWVRADIPVADLAERFLSPAEATAIHAAPESNRLSAFFGCWTRKESFLKARGDGLSLGLDRFDVLDSTDGSVALRTPWDPTEADRWTVRDLWPGQGYAGAVAAAGRCWRLRCWQWPEQVVDLTGTLSVTPGL